MCDFDINTEIILGFFNVFSAVASVGINALYPRKCNHKKGAQCISRLGIVDICRRGRGLQYVTAFDGYYIAFLAFNFLVVINVLLRSGKRGNDDCTVNSSYKKYQV